MLQTFKRMTALLLAVIMLWSPFENIPGAIYRAALADEESVETVEEAPHAAETPKEEPKTEASPKEESKSEEKKPEASEPEKTEPEKSESEEPKSETSEPEKKDSAESETGEPKSEEPESGEQTSGESAEKTGEESGENSEEDAEAEKDGEEETVSDENKAEQEEADSGFERGFLLLKDGRSVYSHRTFDEKYLIGVTDGSTVVFVKEELDNNKYQIRFQRNGETLTGYVKGSSLDWDTFGDYDALREIKFQPKETSSEQNQEKDTDTDPTAVSEENAENNAIVDGDALKDNDSEENSAADTETDIIEEGQPAETEQPVENKTENAAEGEQPAKGERTEENEENSAADNGTDNVVEGQPVEAEQSAENEAENNVEGEQTVEGEQLVEGEVSVEEGEILTEGEGELSENEPLALTELTKEEFLALGLTKEELLASGLTVNDLFAMGLTEDDLFEMGLTEEDLAAMAPKLMMLGAPMLLGAAAQGDTVSIHVTWNDADRPSTVNRPWSVQAGFYGHIRGTTSSHNNVKSFSKNTDYTDSDTESSLIVPIELTQTQLDEVDYFQVYISDTFGDEYTVTPSKYDNIAPDDLTSRTYNFKISYGTPTPTPTPTPKEFTFNVNWNSEDYSGAPRGSVSFSVYYKDSGESSWTAGDSTGTVTLTAPSTSSANETYTVTDTNPAEGREYAVTVSGESPAGWSGNYERQTAFPTDGYLTISSGETPTVIQYNVPEPVTFTVSFVYTDRTKGRVTLQKNTPSDTTVKRNNEGVTLSCTVDGDNWTYTDLKPVNGTYTLNEIAYENGDYHLVTKLPASLNIGTVNTVLFNSDAVSMDFTMTWDKNGYNELQPVEPQISVEYSTDGGSTWNAADSDLTLTLTYDENGTPKGGNVTDLNDGLENRTYRIVVPATAGGFKRADVEGTYVPVSPDNSPEIDWTANPLLKRTNTFTVQFDYQNNEYAYAEDLLVLTADDVNSLLSLQYREAEGSSWKTLNKGESTRFTVGAPVWSEAEKTLTFPCTLQTIVTDADLDSCSIKVNAANHVNFTNTASIEQTIGADSGTVTYTAIAPNEMYFTINWVEGDKELGYRPNGLPAGYQVQYMDAGGSWQSVDPASTEISLTENEFNENVWNVTLKDKLPQSGRQYRVVPADVAAYKELSSNVKSNGVALTPGVEAPSITYEKPDPKKIYFNVVWNDDNNSLHHRPDQPETLNGTNPTNPFKYVYDCSDDGGNTWYTVSTLGIDEKNPAKDNYQTWGYSITDDWPLQNRQYRIKNPGCPPNYTFDGGATSLAAIVLNDDPDSTTSVNYYALTEFTMNFEWRDENNTGIRPADASKILQNFKTNLTLKRNGVEIDWSDIPDGNISINAENGTLTIKDLAAFTGDGDRNDYSVAYPSSIEVDGGDQYVFTSRNLVNYSDSNVHNGGTLVGILTGKTKMEFKKYWIDGAVTTRPEVTLRLYRYAAGAGGSSTDRSPVKGKDSKTIPSYNKTSTENYEFIGTYTYDDDLPKYDENGNKYTYFVIETLSNPGDYVTVIDNRRETENTKGLIFNESVVTNKLSKKTKADIEKEFDAKALQGMDAAVIFTLQKNDGSGWTDVTKSDGAPVTVTVPNFRGEAMMRTATISSYTDIVDGTQKEITLDKYDENGNIVSYRLLETGVIIDEVNQNSHIPEKEGGEYVYSGNYTVGKYEFTRTYEKDANGVTTKVINKLVGEMNYKVRKKWTPSLPEGSTTSYSFKLIRISDKPGSQEETVTDISAENISFGDPVTGVTVGADGIITVTGTVTSETVSTDFICTVLHLPLYSNGGYKYTYYLKEVGIVQPMIDGEPALDENNATYNYGFFGVSYSVEDGVRTGTLSNVHGGGGSAVQFDITKTYVDDGDLMHRKPVQIGLFYWDAVQEKGVLVEDKGGHTLTATLNDDNQWYYRFLFTYDNEEYDAKYFYVKEITVNGNVVSYDNQPVFNDAGWDGGLTGSVTTTDHIYDVYYTCEGSLGQKVVEIFNRRTGEINLSASKTWKIGNLTGLKAVFKLTVKDPTNGIVEITDSNVDGYTYADSNLRSAEWPLSLALDGQSEGTFSAEKLIKYDSEGRLYEYKLEETAIEYVQTNAAGTGSTTVTANIVNGSADIQPVEDGQVYTIYTSGRLDSERVVYGPSHSGDQYPYKFENRVSGSQRMYVNVIWRDQGSQCPRPDLNVRLYRTTDPSQIGSGSEQLVTEKYWNTKINEWQWSLDFGTFSLFDEDGNQYYYYVLEGYVGGSSEYGITYYLNDGEEGQHPHGDASTNHPKDVFIPMENSAYANPGSTIESSGTIINTRSGDLRYDGQKIWQNLPYGYAKEELPSMLMILTQYEEYPIDTLTENSSFSAWYTLVAPDTRFVIEHSGENNSNASVSTAPSSGTALSSPVVYLPKYDEYGWPYQYKISEEFDPNGSVPHGTRPSNMGVDATWVYHQTPLNTYVNSYYGGAGAVFKAAKTFDMTKALGIGQTTYPTVQFRLRKFYDNPAEEITLSKDVSLKTVAGGTIPDSGVISLPVQEFGSDSNRFPYFAPDGSAYQYIIEERIIDGNGDPITNCYKTTSYRCSVTTSDGCSVTTSNGCSVAVNTAGFPVTDDSGWFKVYDTDEDSDYQSAINPGAGQPGKYDNTVNVKNTYDSNKKSLEATKIWVDRDNYYGLRPEIDPTTKQPVGMVYNFYRIEPGQGIDAGVLLNGMPGVSITWDPDETDESKWICRLTVGGEYDPEDVIPKYTTDGREYTYAVKEVLSQPYLKSYTSNQDSRTDNLLSITNTLETVDISITKNWVGYDGSTEHPMDAAQIVAYLRLAGFNVNSIDDVKLVFGLKANHKESWYTGDARYNPEKGLWVSAATSLTPGTSTPMFVKLPKYWYDSNNDAQEYVYTVSEEDCLIGTESIIGHGQTSFFTPADPQTKGYVFKNTLNGFNIDLVKIWDNTANRKSIVFTVRNENNNKAAQVTLNASSTDNKCAASVFVPTGSYEVSEPVPDGFKNTFAVIKGTASVPVTEGKINNITTAGTYGFVNESRVQVEIIKQWKDDAAVKDITRPQYLELTLYRYTDNNRTEQQAKYADGTLVAPIYIQIGEADSYTVSCENLPRYVERTASTAQDGSKEPYHYTLKEKAVSSIDPVVVYSGDITRYYSLGVSETLRQGEGNSKLNAKNSLKQFTLTLDKVWADDEGHETDRPNVTISIYYATSELPADSADWTPYTTETLTLTKNNLVSGTTDKWETKITLPMYNGNGDLLWYKLVEAANEGYNSEQVIIFAATSYLEDPNRTQEFDNTLQPVKVTVTKEWSGWDANNTTIDDQPTLVNVTLYRRIGSDGAWTSIETKQLSASNSWTYTWEGLPAYTGGVGDVPRTPLYYKVVETRQHGTYVTYIAETSKTHDTTVTADPADQYVLNDQKIPAYYAPDYIGDSAGAKTKVVNTPMYVQLKAKKAWDDNHGSMAGITVRPTDLTVTLQYRIGSSGGWTNVPLKTSAVSGWVKGPVTGSLTEDEWSILYTQLPMYTGTDSNRELIYYRLNESSVPQGYTATYSPVLANGIKADDLYKMSETPQNFQWTITDTLKKLKLTVEKTWIEDTTANPLLYRPATIYVMPQYKIGTGNWQNLPTANSEPIALTASTNSSTNWKTTYSWQGVDTLPCCDAAGNVITYRWVECNQDGTVLVENGDSTIPNGYVVTYGGTGTYQRNTDTDAQTTPEGNITPQNTLKTFDVTVDKLWAGEGIWAFFARPEGVTLTLQYRMNGTSQWTSLVSRELKDSDKKTTWSTTFGKLPAYDSNGTLYEYRIIEETANVPVGYTLTSYADGATESSARVFSYTDGEREEQVTNTMQTTAVKAKKLWPNDSAPDRPDSVKLTLQYSVDGGTNWTNMADGSGTVQKKDAASTEYKVEFTGLPTYDKNGNAVSYRVVELAADIPGGYVHTADIIGSWNDTDEAWEITNPYDPITITATKSWVGDDLVNHPAVVLKLYKKAGTSGAKTEVTAENTPTMTLTHTEGTWVWKWEGLPRYTGTGTGRVPYIYTVEEVYPDNASRARYTTTYKVNGTEKTEASVSGANAPTENTALVTNTLKPFKLTVEKTWEDGALAGITRPGLSNEFTVTLKRKITNGSDITVSTHKAWAVKSGTTNVWTLTIPNLPAYDDNGNEYTYWVTETAVPGYTATSLDSNTTDTHAYVGNQDDASIGVPVLTLKNTVITTERYADKLWTNDSNWLNTYRPTSITLTLQYSVDNGTTWTDAAVSSIGIAGDQTCTVNTTDGTVKPTGKTHAFNWEDLPTYKRVNGEGKAVIYRIVEKDVPMGYVSTADREGTDESNKTVTYTNEFQLTRFKAYKVWVDDVTNQKPFAIRPDTVVLTLQAKAGSGSWADFKNDSGQVITITLGDDTTTKSADGKTWSKIVENLPVYDQNGDEYTYRAVEKTVPNGYTAVKNGTDTAAAPELGTETIDSKTVQNSTVTNTAKVLELKVKKNWPSGTEALPEAIYVIPQYKVGTGSWQNLPTTDSKPIQLTADGNWTATYGDVLCYDANGSAISYRFLESNADGTETATSGGESIPAGYTVTYPADIVGSDSTAATTKTYEITNTLNTIGIDVTKTWTGDESPDDWTFFARPDSITYTLYRKSTAETKAKVGNEVTVTETEEWKHTFSDLRTHDTAGNPYTYWVEETAINGYTTAYTGENGAPKNITKVTAGDDKKDAEAVTNTLVTTEVKAKKLWPNDSAADRPDSVLLTLQYSIDGGTSWANMVDDSGIALQLTASKDNYEVTFTNLPTYDKNGNAVSYHVVERVVDIPKGYAGYGGTADIIGVWKDTDKVWEITNPYDPISVKGTKIWVGDTAVMRPGVELVLWHKTSKGVDEQVTVGTDATPGNPIRCTHTDGTYVWEWTNLPQYTGTGSDRVAYTYYVKEVITATGTQYEASDYVTDYDGNTEPTEFTNESGETTITNTLKPFLLKIQKTWEDNTLASLIRPSDLSIELRRSTGGAGTTGEKVEKDVTGTDISLAWTIPQSGNTWTITVPNLPAYDDNGGLYTYWTTEEQIPGYYNNDGWKSGNTVNGQDSIGNQDESKAPLLVMTNYVDTVERSAEKNWAGEDKSGLQWNKIYRPASLTLTLQYKVGDMTDFADAGAAVGVANPDRTVTVDKDADTIPAANFKWENLPKMVLVGEGTAREAKQVTYRIVEKTVPYGYVVSPTASDPTKATETFTNTFQVTSLPVKKVWDDISNRYQIRPASVTFTVQSTTDATLASGWADLKDGSGTAVTVTLTGSGDEWTATVQNLPMVNTVGAKLYYRAVEKTVPTGYTSATAAEPVLTTDSSGNVTLSTVTNKLETVRLKGKKFWNDYGDKYSIRPTPTELELVILVSDSRVVPQPTITFTDTTEESGARWSYETSEVPKYIKNSSGEVVQADYYVQETNVRSEYAPEPASGIVPTTGPESGWFTADLLTNNLVLKQLRIDNITTNPAHTDITNAGGFVSVADDPLTQRDVTDWRDNALYVSWKPDYGWCYAMQITVKYQEYGEDEDYWTTVRVNNMSDLAALKTRYPNASYVQLKDGSRRLILADDTNDMPYRTEVDVFFAPTVAVENTTAQNRFGKVKVEGGEYNRVWDGRYEQKVVYGKADDGMHVLMKHIQIGPVGSVSGTYKSNSGTTIYVNSSGRFDEMITVEVAGVKERINVTGSVKVLDRNEEGQATYVKVILDRLDVPLDVGIPFAGKYIPNDVPKTGDMLFLVLGLAGISGAAYTVATLKGKGRRKKEDKNDAEN